MILLYALTFIISSVFVRFWSKILAKFDIFDSIYQIQKFVNKIHFLISAAAELLIYSTIPYVMTACFFNIIQLV